MKYLLFARRLNRPKILRKTCILFIKSKNLCCVVLCNFSFSYINFIEKDYFFIVLVFILLLEFSFGNSSSTHVLSLIKSLILKVFCFDDENISVQWSCRIHRWKGEKKFFFRIDAIDNTLIHLSLVFIQKILAFKLFFISAFMSNLC